MSQQRAQRGIPPRALLGAGVLIGGAMLWVFAFTGGLSTLFSSPTKVIRADFQSIEDIVPNDPVRINGVQVGSVASDHLDPGGRGTTLTLDIDTNEPIYANASASIVWRTALGANDAVALYPGTRSAGLLGDRTIPQSQDSNQVELDQVTQAFGGGARSGMRTMLQQLPSALASRPALARDFTTLTQVAPVATAGIGAVRGEIADTDLKALIRNTGQAAQAMSVGTGAATTRQFVQSAATTLDAIGADPADLRSTISGLQVVMPLLATASGRVTHTTALLDPLLAKLIPEVPQVVPTVRALNPAVADAHHLLIDATPLVRQLRPTVASIARTARIGMPVINAASPSLTRLADQILPGIAKKSPEESVPPYQLFTSTLAGFGTWGGFFNKDGDQADFAIGLGDAQASQLLPCQEDFSGTDFLVCSTLSDALQEYFTGGTSLLQSLIGRPGGASIFGPLLTKAQQLQAQLTHTRATLDKSVPALAKWLFVPNHGAGR